jgi:hypothetical protein
VKGRYLGPEELAGLDELLAEACQREAATLEARDYPPAHSHARGVVCGMEAVRDYIRKVSAVVDPEAMDYLPATDVEWPGS